MALSKGMKTSEFVISLLLFLLGLAALVVDYQVAGGTWYGQGVALLVSAAGALGYSIPRAQLKKRDIEAEATKALAAAKQLTDENPS